MAEPFSLFYLPFRPALDANGIVVPGASLTFYRSGTNELQPIYADAGLTTPLANPLTANAAGRWPAIYINTDLTYRVVLLGQMGETLDSIDPYEPGSVGGLTGKAGPSNNTRASIATLRAAAITDLTSLFDASTWTWTAGDFTGLVDDRDVVASDQTALTAGAWVRDVPRPIYSHTFPTLEAALDAWCVTGGTLVISRDHVQRTPMPIKMLSQGKAYRMTSDRRRTVKYDGPFAMRFVELDTVGPAPICIDGDIVFDGNNKVPCPLIVGFQSCTYGNRRDGLFRGLTGVNGRTHMGQFGSSGLRFQGGFDHLTLENLVARDISREAGAGNAGSQGCTGIQYNNAGPGANALHILMRDLEVDTVTTDDAVGSPERVDCDGIYCYQAQEPGASAPILEGFTIRNAVGRGVKMFTLHGGPTVRDGKILLNSPPITPGTNMIDIQVNEGLVENIEMEVSGAAAIGPGKVRPLSIGSNYMRDEDNPFGSVTVRKIKVNDTTGVVRDVFAAFNYPFPYVRPRNFVLDDIVDTGKTAQLFSIGALGSTEPVHFRLADVVCTVTSALTITDDDMRFLSVSVANLDNTNATPVPVARFLNGQERTTRWGFWWGDAMCSGVHRYTGAYWTNPLFHNGLCGPGGVEAIPAIPGSSVTVGRVAVPIFQLAPGETWTGPAVGGYSGSTGGDYEFAVRLVSDSLYGRGRWYTEPSSTALTQVQPFPQIGGVSPVEVLAGGAGPGTAGKVSIWKQAAGQNLQIRNNRAEPIRVAVVFEP